MANTPKRTISSTNLASVNPTPVEWLWRGRIARGKMNLADGEPGQGKGLLWADIVARVTTSGVMPDGTQGPIGSVVVLGAEDGLADTVRPRLDAAGADVSRVETMDGIRVEGRDRPIPVMLPQHVDDLQEFVDRNRAVLVIIDPLFAFVDRHYKMISDPDIRQALSPLGKMAQQTRAAVLLVRHLNKQAGAKAMYRGGGSIAIIGVCRCAHLIGAHPDDDTDRIKVLAPIKSNLGRKSPPLCFEIVPIGETARIRWLGETEWSADDLVGSGRRSRQTSDEDLDDLVLEYLTAVGGMATRSEIDKQVPGRHERIAAAVERLLAGGRTEERRLRRCSTNGSSRISTFVCLAGATVDNTTREMFGLATIDDEPDTLREDVDVH